MYKCNADLRDLRDNGKLDIQAEEKILQNQTVYYTTGRGLNQSNDMFFADDT